MPEIHPIIRQLLIPSGSRREKLAQTLLTFLLMLRQRQAMDSEGETETAASQLLPRKIKSLRQISLRQIYRNFQLLWIRGSSSVSYLQMTYRYQDWMKETEPDAKQLATQQQEEANLAYRPLISFLTPVYNPGITVLRDTLHSVQAQTYSNWEFCLANGSTDPAVQQLLDEYAQQDRRIRVVQLTENMGISENTNRALDIVQGEFIALLDHDDLVAPDMLYEVVAALNQDRNWDVIYFDEDKVSEESQIRTSPWFKPSQFSPDLLLSTNYLMHSVIRRQLIVDLGGFDSDMDGAQDWDLALRLVENTKKIHHLPRVFYHWRQVEGSAARDANAKPWAFAAQERCIQRHLKRQGYDNAQVSFPRLGTVRIIWPTQQAKVSIIIPTKNKLELLQPCIESILTKTTYPNYEILVVDNQSDDPAMKQYYQSLIDNPRVRVLDYLHPYNFQKINNWAARQSDSDVLLFLNNDTEVIEPTWLEEMVGWAMRPEIGVVGTKLLRPNGKIQHAGIIMGLIGHGSHIFEECDDHVYTHFGSVDWYRNYQAVTGACVAVRRAVFDELNGLDEAYIVGFGDIDLCLRVQEAGYRNVYTPFAAMLHHEGGTRGLSLPPSDVLRAAAKMYAMVQKGDGFFNPNLSYSSRQPVVSAMKEEDRGRRLLRIMYEFGLMGIGTSKTIWEKQLANLSPELLTTKPSVSIVNPMQMSRILIVTHELTRSGAPIILWMLAKYLKDQGYSIQVICPVDGALKDDFLAEQIPVSVVPRLLDDAQVVTPYLNDTDVVLCNTILTWRVVHAARAFSRPCLWWVHETVFGSNLASQNAAIAQAFTA
ncbi:MAG: glycosyltransferase, partial [Anaerolineales bacterium]|nr:glycosyltransferase [Anaerolineales bacterium]